MAKKIYCLFYIALNFIGNMQCTTTISLDLIPVITGRISTVEGDGIDSVAITIQEIDAIGHSSVSNYINKTSYSDMKGEYTVDLPGGIEWVENRCSKKRTYTKYIKQVTLIMTKSIYRDTIFASTFKDYEESMIEKNITLIKSE